MPPACQAFINWDLAISVFYVLFFLGGRKWLIIDRQRMASNASLTVVCVRQKYCAHTVLFAKLENKTWKESMMYWRAAVAQEVEQVVESGNRKVAGSNPQLTKLHVEAPLSKILKLKLLLMSSWHFAWPLFYEFVCEWVNVTSVWRSVDWEKLNRNASPFNVRAGICKLQETSKSERHFQSICPKKIPAPLIWPPSKYTKSILPNHTESPVALAVQLGDVSERRAYGQQTVFICLVY